MRLRALAAAALTAAAFGLTAAAPGAPQLRFPVACEIGRTCEIQRYVDRDPGPGLLDYRCGRRTGEKHDGTDIRLLNMAAQRRGVEVMAAASGVVFRTRDGVADVSVKEVGAESVNAIGCGNAVVIDHPNGWRTGYCHMANGSVRVKPGDRVEAGQVIGKIGLSGLTEFPHLHFSVLHNGAYVDPFAPAPVKPGACPAQTSLWAPAVARTMPYKAGTLLNFGFAGSAVSMAQVEAGQLAPVSPAAEAIAIYARVLQVDGGDQLELILTGPGGVLAQQKLAPFDRDKAQYFQFIGKKRPATGWPKGAYTGVVRLWRAGKPVIERKIETRL